MRHEPICSIKHPFKYPSLWLLAVAICLCPAAAQALDPTSTATGTGALFSETTGSRNTADGYDALNQTTTGHSNTASGYRALFANTTGYFNTASSAFALYNNTTGTLNTASGAAALYVNTTGRNNVAVGANALYALKGSNNIALGFNAGKNTTSGNGNIYIGDPGIRGNESNVMRIGRGLAKTFIGGIAGKPLSGATVVVKSNGQLGVVASSARYKRDIKPLAGAADGVAEKLRQLRPVSYRYKTEPEATHYGLIAEEVDRVMPELVVRDGENRPESVQYQELIPLLLQQWKAQREMNARQEAENARQHALIERQQRLLERQQSRLERQEATLTELRRTLATRLAAFDGADRGDRTGGK
jgi:trimeric autotransporter adhesin